MQELLEVMGIPYTGSGVSACIRAADKVAGQARDARRRDPHAGLLLVQRDRVQGAGRRRRRCPAIEARLQFPIVVKPACQGSALGIKFARTAADVPAALVAAFSYDRKVLLERYVAGPRPGGLGARAADGAPRALPIVEAVPEQEDFYDFESRYEIGRTRFVCPAELRRRGRPSGRSEHGAGRCTSCSAAPGSPAST